MNNENKQLLLAYLKDIKNEIDLIINYDSNLINIDNLNNLYKTFKKEYKNIKGGK